MSGGGENGVCFSKDRRRKRNFQSPENNRATGRETTMISLFRRVNIVIATK